MLERSCADEALALAEQAVAILRAGEGDHEELLAPISPWLAARRGR